MKPPYFGANQCVRWPHFRGGSSINTSYLGVSLFQGVYIEELHCSSAFIYNQYLNFREEMKKIRHERNLFRTKYFGVKETCSCGAVDRIKTGKSTCL